MAERKNCTSPFRILVSRECCVNVFRNVYLTHKHALNEIGADYLWHRAVEVLHIKDLELHRNWLVFDALL